MLQNPRKTLGFKKNMVYKIPPGGGGKPYPASGLNQSGHENPKTILFLITALIRGNSMRTSIKSNQVYGLFVLRL